MPSSLHIDMKNQIETIFPATRRILGELQWKTLTADNPEPPTVPALIAMCGPEHDAPPYLADLARMELAIDAVSAFPVSPSPAMDVNPSLQVLPFGWRNLPGLVGGSADAAPPEPGDQMVLVWKQPDTGDTMVRPAADEDLLALKMVVEGLTSRQVASEGNLPVSAVDAMIGRAVQQGLLLAPPSGLVREPDIFTPDERFGEDYFSTGTFTLQWHITQVCDLHCRHCYDRSDRFPLAYEKAVEILDQLHAFCHDRHVRGRVSFTGGNPLMYPRFADLYRETVERGLVPAILGNPAPRRKIEEIIEIQMPDFIQVSLEGLEEQNDSIRGKGHFGRTIEFLKILKELGVYSMVMLTLTRDNMEQIIPLGERLRGLADTFNFNRLSLVGEGAKLHLPDREAYIGFLKRYCDAADENPVLGLKDSLINILKLDKGEEPFGGCTGFGCGAAFNFLALLPDGEAHACRKFPSPIGNIHRQTLAEIYDSEQARRYRRGCSACNGCPVRPGCGGCLAIAHSLGLDVFSEKDPYCFIEPASGSSL